MAPSKQTGSAKAKSKPPGENGSKKPVKRRKKKAGRTGKLFIWLLITGILGVCSAMAGYMFIMLNGEKLFRENIDKLDLAEASIVYDVNNQEMVRLARENRVLVDMNEIPPLLSHAFIATEDKRFNQHSGIDFWSIGRALVKDIIQRRAVEGGSTITQQLAKNLFLNADKTIFRKATEASIALALEQNLTKDDILELYLNRIYFGNRAYGIKAAAQKYFGESDLNKLELWEMATLAAIPKAPAHYNPIDHPDRSKERRGVVLMLMRDQGYISEEERAKAAAVDYDYTPPTVVNHYTTFVDYMLNEAVEKSGLTEDELLRGGFGIYTTMDPSAQQAMETVYANDKLFQKDGPRQKMQSAMVILDHKTGGIVGMIGGRGYKTKEWNRAVQPRQPGSAFKPLVAFAPAMELNFNKYNPNSILKDEKMSFGSYSPNNWDNVYLGGISMSMALQKSANVTSVWLLNEIGITKGMDFVKKLGIELDSAKDRNLAIALGGLTKGVSPLQMAAAYGAFANNGQMHETHSVVKIVNADDEEVYSYKADKPKQVMSAKTAWYMTTMLKNAVDRGTGTSAKMNRPVAGKTGTTQLDLKGLEKYNRDVWFAGYTPEWTAAVWMGFDITDSEHYVSGGSAGSAVLFKEVMTKALASHKVVQFQKPNSVPELAVSPKAITDLMATLKPEKGDVRLVWSPVESENVVYRIFRKGGQDSDFTLLAETASPLFDDLAVPPGNRYDYHVIVYHTKDDLSSGKSNEVTIEVPKSADPGTGNGNTPGNGTTPGNGNGPGNGTTPGGGSGSGNGTTPGGGSGSGNGTTPGGGSGSGNGTTPGSGSGSGNGTTPGSGSGSGNGTTPGSGSGPGSGTTPGSGSGPGSGTTPGGGSGPGSGTTSGGGSGPGSGTTSGTGSGPGSGTTSGTGSGVGSGTTSGTGSGPGSGTTSGTGSGTTQ